MRRRSSRTRPSRCSWSRSPRPSWRPGSVSSRPAGWPGRSRSSRSPLIASLPGDLSGRSGLADRADEFGDVGRSFDDMAAALQRSDVERRRFIQDAVHELRTPLAVIDGTAGALEEGIFAPSPRHLRTIRDQVRQLSRIVDDLRTIGLAETGQLELAREDVDVSRFSRRRSTPFRSGRRPMASSSSWPFSPRWRSGVTRARIRQVVAALTDNALRHTPKDGRVRFVGERLGSAARISVEDTGAGIADEDLPHVFDRFYQADASRDRRTGTSGLGLSIVRALVEAHGGQVGAENVEMAARESGSSFPCLHPVGGPSSRRSGPRRAARRPGRYCPAVVARRRFSLPQGVTFGPSRSSRWPLRYLSRD